MKCFQWNFAPPCFALDFDESIERGESDAEIGWMRRDATLAPTQYRMQPGVAAARVAA
jgi:hypothetical protein